MSQSRTILSVSQLNRTAKELLETQLPLLWVEGEISNFARPSSGHWYFSLKDTNAQVRCAMFKGRNISVRFKPNNGDKVLLRARVSLYEGRGDYQLIAEHMEASGEGDLQRQYEMIKARLGDEGLFDTERKKALPAWPATLGVITSPTGAAIHDILHVLKRRYPALPVRIIPTTVQGQGAAEQIAHAIELVNRLNIADVLIVGRGGGSLEDLWAFNEEVVARAIANSAIPIISAVGHEVDFTIADFTADVRAPTPSAAAEIVSPNGAELARTLSAIEASLIQNIRQTIAYQQRELRSMRLRLRHPGERLQQQSQTLDRLELRLNRAGQNVLRSKRQSLNTLTDRMMRQSPALQLQHKSQALKMLSHRLDNSFKQFTEHKQQQLQKAAALLNSFSPLNTIKRGYAIVETAENAVVKSINDVSLGQTVSAKLANGSLTCTVIDKTSS